MVPVEQLLHGTVLDLPVIVTSMLSELILREMSSGLRMESMYVMQVINSGTLRLLVMVQEEQLLHGMILEEVIWIWIFMLRELILLEIHNGMLMGRLYVMQLRMHIFHKYVVMVLEEQLLHGGMREEVEVRRIFMLRELIMQEIHNGMPMGLLYVLRNGPNMFHKYVTIVQEVQLLRGGMREAEILTSTLRR